MNCPTCGNQNLHPVTEVESTSSGKSKGFGAGKGCIGAIFLGPIGWLCGLCGMGKSKSKSKTTSTTYWMCNQCGNKFKA